MAELKVFPIGYIASTNNVSKGSITSGGTEDQPMFEPNAGSQKTKLGYSAQSRVENRAIWTRKVGEHRHMLAYNYKDIFNWEFKQIRRFIRDVASFQVNSFYVVDFSSGQKISALATGANWNASIYDTTDFSATTGEGGNYCCIWYPRNSQFRIGVVNVKNEDSSIGFPNTSDWGDLSTFALGEVYAYPMYRCFMKEDKEEFKVNAYVDVDMNASFAGPVRSGKIEFIQRDVK
jgi:hypothetical protein